jgi:DNA polymerase I-like protein with 3'-5' exonuclease and polymerase domains
MGQTALRGHHTLTRRTMEQAVILDVPLKVETGTGPDWMAAK